MPYGMPERGRTDRSRCLRSFPETDFMSRASIVRNQAAADNSKLVEARRAKAEPRSFHDYCE